MQNDASAWFTSLKMDLCGVYEVLFVLGFYRFSLEAGSDEDWSVSVYGVSVRGKIYNLQHSCLVCSVFLLTVSDALCS